MNAAAARFRSPSAAFSAMASAFSVHHGPPPPSSFTVTALGRWSVLNVPLPAVDKIKALHVYDFDNTLFKTPTPNPALWIRPTIGTLFSNEEFANGGWWHDSRILAATGEGFENEEPRAWEGWWNEKIVDLVRLSMLQEDALCVLLTGRSEKGFADLIRKMVIAKGLEFDIIGLKPLVSPTNQRFQNTMNFKQLFLESVMETYSGAKELRIYEDRPNHTKGFRQYFTEYNRRQTASPTRGPLEAHVIQVADSTIHLDPVMEVAEVQHMINSHNAIVAKQPEVSRQPKLRIKKTVFFTGYMIAPEDQEKLIKLAQTPPNVGSFDLKYHANNILICPRPCPASILEKVGGMGSKMRWEVTGTACLDNNVWAACLSPVPSTATYHTDNPCPLVVLALRKGSRPIEASRIKNWQPVPPEQRIVFETTVGEKVLLRIEGEDPKEDEYESLFANKSSKRKHTGDEDWNLKPQGHHGNRNESRGGRGGRGRGGNSGRGSRGGQRGTGRGGRGRGGFHNYRSLDDVEPKNQHGGYGLQVNYDDTYQAPGQGQGQPPSHAPTGPSQGQQGWNSQSRGQGGSHGRPGVAQGPGGPDLQSFY